MISMRLKRDPAFARCRCAASTRRVAATSLSRSRSRHPLLERTTTRRESSVDCRLERFDDAARRRAVDRPFAIRPVDGDAEDAAADSTMTPFSGSWS